MLKKSLIIGLGIMHACLGFSQRINFSVKETSFSSSANDEFAPMYFNEGLVFCSNSLSNTSIKNEDGKLFNILHIQKRDSSNWKSPGLFSKELTTILNEGPATFKPDELTVFYARNNLIEGKFKDINDPSNTMGIYSAEFKDGVWGNIQAFAYNSMEYSLGTPALSPNGLRIYFASDMPGGFGGTDLYYSDFFSGKWQEPVNMGEAINTKGNESYPFINQGGLLFFSSDGWPGNGGKDIFYSARLNGIWQPPIHLGANINTESDDYGLITDINFEEGYFSSNRKYSDDIYSFKSEMPQFGYCDTISPNPQCFAFYDDRFTDTLHLEYEWNFGKGIVKKGYKVEHCFSNPGSYEVLLTIVHHLADSVFETKSVHRFELENIQPVFINSEQLVVENTPINFKAFLKDFNDFKVIDSYWDFGEGYTNQGAEARHSFAGTGKSLVAYGLVGPKDNYGRVPRKCFVQQIKVVKDIQEIYTEYVNPRIIQYSETELEQLSRSFPDNKNNKESFRLEFAVLSNDLPIVDADYIENSLSEFSTELIQIENDMILPNSLATIDKILHVINNFPNQKLVIAVHKDNKGNAKSIQQSTDFIANQLKDLFRVINTANIEIECIGYGDRRPVVNHKTKYAQFINQRIEFIVYSVPEEN